MNKRQARKIARLYIGKIAQQDDVFNVEGLSDEEQEMIQNEIDSIANWLLGDSRYDAPTEQSQIVSYVMCQ